LAKKPSSSSKGSSPYIDLNIVVFKIIKVIFREFWLRMKIDKESCTDVSGYDVMCVITVRASYLPLPKDEISALLLHRCINP
jgi:hypothetical protein